jgi:hypothetical protein
VQLAAQPQPRPRGRRLRSRGGTRCCAAAVGGGSGLFALPDWQPLHCTSLTGPILVFYPRAKLRRIHSTRLLSTTRQARVSNTQQHAPFPGVGRGTTASPVRPNCPVPAAVASTERKRQLRPLCLWP